MKRTNLMSFPHILTKSCQQTKVVFQGKYIIIIIIIIIISIIATFSTAPFMLIDKNSGVEQLHIPINQPKPDHIMDQFTENLNSNKPSMMSSSFKLTHVVSTELK